MIRVSWIFASSFSASTIARASASNVSRSGSRVSRLSSGTEASSAAAGSIWVVIVVTPSSASFSSADSSAGASTVAALSSIVTWWSPLERPVPASIVSATHTPRLGSSWAMANACSHAAASLSACSVIAILSTRSPSEMASAKSSAFSSTSSASTGVRCSAWTIFLTQSRSSISLASGARGGGGAGAISFWTISCRCSAIVASTLSSTEVFDAVTFTMTASSFSASTSICCGEM